MIQAVMDHLPQEWEKEHSYTNKLYTLHDIDSSSQEVYEFKNSFNKPVSKIVRLQNPYMYGRYILRKEYYKWNMNSEIDEEYKYHILNKSDQDIVCEYGCDYRRYGMSTSKQKNPDNTSKFYGKYEIEIENSEEIIVAVKVMKQIVPYYDNDYYPQYFIYFNNLS